MYEIIRSLLSVQYVAVIDTEPTDTHVLRPEYKNMQYTTEKYNINSGWIFLGPVDQANTKRSSAFTTTDALRSRRYVYVALLPVLDIEIEEEYVAVADQPEKIADR